MLASLDWRLTLICLVIFVGSVALTRYVSLGSIIVAAACFAVNLVFSWKGMYGLTPFARVVEFWGVAGAVSAMAIWRHRANIKRLLAGNENKLWGNKKV